MGSMPNGPPDSKSLPGESLLAGEVKAALDVVMVAMPEPLAIAAPSSAAAASRSADTEKKPAFRHSEAGNASETSHDASRIAEGVRPVASPDPNPTEE